MSVQFSYVALYAP